MRLQAILEGLSPVLYHSTDVSNAASIIKQNKFKLTLDLGTDAEIEKRGKDKFYYLSTSRTRSGEFTQSQAGGSANAMFVLDGRKLQAKYSGAPVDYWSSPTYRDPSKSESEDRVYHNKQYINNASKYIKEVHLFYDDIFAKEYGHKSDRIKSNIKRAYTLFKKKGIPVYLYDNAKDYVANRRDKAIPVTILDTKEDLSTYSNIRGEDKYNYSDVVRKDPKTRKRFKHTTFAIWKELYYKNKISQLSKRAKKELYSLGSYKRDMINSLKADIHNYRKKYDMSGLTNIFRKEGFNSVEEFIVFLDDKWYEIKEKYRNMGIRDGIMPKTEQEQIEFVTYNSLNVKDLFDLGIIPSQKVQIALVSNDPYAIKYLEDEGIRISEKVRRAAEEAEKEKQ